METKNFNPVLKAVISIRHLAMAAAGNWSNMEKIGDVLDQDLNVLDTMVTRYAEGKSKQQWQSEMNTYVYNVRELKRILEAVTSKIKVRDAEGSAELWNTHPKYVGGIENSFSELYEIGKGCLPENELQNWDKQWAKIHSAHKQIQNEAEACSIQLGLMEELSPEEVNELTDTILRHIPLNYDLQEVEKYNEEYMEAYKELKKEASQKKNLWDRFLDLLAGGLQQTPAQRVMMQRWVAGEKGDLH